MHIQLCVCNKHYPNTDASNTLGLVKSQVRNQLAHSGAKEYKNITLIHRDCENFYKFNIIILTFYKCVLNQIIYIKFNLKGKFNALELPSLHITFDSEIQYLL